MIPFEEDYSNSAEENHWNKFKVGDIITAYHAGYHEILSIKRRFISKDDIKYYSSLKNKKVGDERSPIITYKRIATKFGKRINGPIKSCDSAYCELASISLQKEIEAIQEKLKLLEVLKKELKEKKK